MQDDHAMSVEVSAVIGAFGSVATCNEQPGSAHAIAVYIRNPHAMHVQDFHVPTAASLEQAKADAFTYADALAEHLGCKVVSQLDRGPAPVPVGELIDAAMCLWEVAIEIHESVPAMAALWEARGTSDMRYRIGGWAEPCHREWQTAHDAGEFDGCFDWEWCPKWLRERIEWDELGATLKPKASA